ncbi:MAG: discoidin domain-containing protein [Sphingobacteriales bacterium]
MKKVIIRSIVTCLFITVGTLSSHAQKVITAEKGKLTIQYESPKEGEMSANIIDGNTATKYYNPNATAIWIQFEPKVKSVANQYSISSANDMPDRDPKDWTLQGSDDGKTWTTLDTRKNEVFTDRFQTKIFKFSNKVAYSYYRLDIQNVVNGNELQLSEWALLKD